MGGGDGLDANAGEASAGASRSRIARMLDDARLDLAELLAIEEAIESAIAEVATRENEDE